MKGLKRFLMICMMLLSVCLMLSMVACKCNKCSKSDDEGTATFKVMHVYELLDGTEKTVVETYKTDVGAEVTAEDKLETGYVFDDKNAENLITGVVDEISSLVLIKHYRLIESSVTQVTVGDGTVTISVSGTPVTVAKYGQTVTLQAQADEGKYVNQISVKKANGEAVSVENGSFTMPAEEVTVSVSFGVDTRMAYTVERWVENLAGDGYVFQGSETLSAERGTEVSATEKEVVGFTFDRGNVSNVNGGTLSADSSLVLKQYYTRNTYAITANSADITVASSTKYGAAVSGTVSLRAGYYAKIQVKEQGATTICDTLEVYGETFTFTAPACAAELSVEYLPRADMSYKVEYYLENVNDDGYSLQRAEEHEGVMNATVTATVRDFVGYEWDGNASGTQTSGAVDAVGGLTLKLYYKALRFTQTLKNYDGSTKSSKSVKYGATGATKPTDSLEFNGTIGYWADESGAPYDFDAPVKNDVVVQLRAYDKLIYTVNDFVAAFSMEKSSDAWNNYLDGGKGSVTYTSTQPITGAYILMADIDFEKAHVRVSDFSGYLEGNGYALKNIMLEHTYWWDKIPSGLFTKMSGTVRNIYFDNIRCNTLFYGQKGEGLTLPDGLGAIGDAGLVAGYLSGTLENVKITGSMLGRVWNAPSWNANDRSPKNANGEKPSAGLVAFDISGATLKNVVVDVSTEVRKSGNTVDGVSLIAGIGVCEVENVYVVAGNGEATANRSANGVASPAVFGISFDKLGALSSSMQTALNSDFWDASGSSPVLKKQCVGYVTPEPANYTVETYIEKEAVAGEYTKTTDVKSYYKGFSVTAEVAPPQGYWFDDTYEGNVLSGIVAEDGSLTLKVYYQYKRGWDENTLSFEWNRNSSDDADKGKVATMDGSAYGWAVHMSGNNNGGEILTGEKSFLTKNAYQARNNNRDPFEEATDVNVGYSMTLSPASGNRALLVFASGKISSGMNTNLLISVTKAQREMLKNGASYSFKLGVLTNGNATVDLQVGMKDEKGNWPWATTSASNLTVGPGTVQYTTYTGTLGSDLSLSDSRIMIHLTNWTGETVTQDGFAMWILLDDFQIIPASGGEPAAAAIACAEAATPSKEEALPTVAKKAEDSAEATPTTGA